jgi:WD40 repeat protein
VLSPGGERLYLISEFSPVQRKHMPAALQSAGALMCWELPKANKQFVIREDAAPQPRLRTVVFTGDGALMAAICEPRTIVVWDAITGKELHTFTEVDARQLAVNGDGTLLAAATQGKVRCWDLRTGTESASVNLNVPASENRGIFAGDTATAVGRNIVLSSDGQHLAVSDSRRVIETWNIAKGSRTKRYKLDKEVDSGIADVAFSPDATRLAAVGRESTGESFGWRTYAGHLYVWDVANGQLVHHSTFHGGRGPHRLVFRRDSKRLMVVSEQDVNLCHLK